MKKLSTLFMVVITMFLFSNQLAFADGKGKKVEFARDVVINGTEVKKGKYKAEFDEQKNELTIWKGSKLIAKSSAQKRIHKGIHKSIATEIMIVKQNDKSLLKGIALAGEQEAIWLDVNTVNVSPQ